MLDPPAGMSVVELMYAMECLSQQHLINHFPANDMGESGHAESADAVFWDSLGHDSAVMMTRLQQTKIAVLDLTGSTAQSALTGLLAKHAIQVQAQVDATTRLQVVIVDDYLHPELAAINQLNHQRKLPWLLAKPAGQLMWIGPLHLPGATACWQCLQHRLQYRRKLSDYLRRHQSAHVSVAARSAAFSSATDLAYACISAEITKFAALQGVPNDFVQLPSIDHVITLHALTYQREQHAVIRRPQCPCCGNPRLIAEQQLRPLILDFAVPVQSRDGGLRQKSAQQVKDALQRHISPITGIIGVTNTIKLAGDVQGVTISVAAEHNFSLIDNDSSFLQERIRSCSGGKGSTLIQAQASALCESIERFSGMYQGDEKRIAGTMAELPNAIHPNDCLLFSEAQYQHRALINAAGSRIAWVPEPFDPTAKVDWTPFWSLTHQAFYYLPTCYCFYGYARQANCSFAKADSNGCAAGSSLAEAVLQGFLELVERDAAALWWYQRSRKRGVDWRSFNEPYLSEVQQYYASCGRTFWVLDITSDLGIPCFVALCAKPGAAAEEITFAFGAHFDAKIALLRAVTELNQIMPNLAQEKNTTLQSLGVEALRWWQEVRLEDQPYLNPNEEAMLQYHSYPNVQQLTLEAALAACLDITQKKSLNLLVLDQTRPDTGLSVVKVVVPSLRHFWPRFAPGRLYSEATATEAALNPYPIFI
ncbi:TOMM precursor leader peptide-binding protein [Iodobacter arcticus]|uniref:TOMM leader peptide-binding protein n=1 Tax=Iodobacter arcticus TaxID=590593 RepID=A0ABW2R133_9NEIS